MKVVSKNIDLLDVSKTELDYLWHGLRLLVNYVDAAEKPTITGLMEQINTAMLPL
jgi:hypothetical protein